MRELMIEMGCSKEQRNLVIILLLSLFSWDPWRGLWAPRLLMTLEVFITFAFLPAAAFQVCLHHRKMTFIQGQCEDDCYFPCNYGNLYSYRGYDCGSPCGYRGYGGLHGYRGLFGFGDRYSHGGLYGYRGIYGSGDCYGYGGLHGGYRGFYGSGDFYGYPGYYLGRYGYPFGSRYGQRFGYGSCYSC